jgi:hypothetical protein
MHKRILCPNSLANDRILISKAAKARSLIESIASEVDTRQLHLHLPSLKSIGHNWSYLACRIITLGPSLAAIHRITISTNLRNACIVPKVILDAWLVVGWKVGKLAPRRLMGALKADCVIVELRVDVVFVAIHTEFLQKTDPISAPLSVNSS